MTMPSGKYLRTKEIIAKMKISACESYDRPFDDIERFWSYVDVKGLFDCWEWKGGFSNSGYGQFKANGKVKQSHRFAYESYYGEIPEGLHILHKCHNRKCCNPFHVYAGTNQDNINDKVGAGRQSRGETSGRSNLTSMQIIEIRENKLNLSRVELGKIYQVNPATISKIALHKSWKHI
jgi:hypothetical protein